MSKRNFMGKVEEGREYCRKHSRVDLAESELEKLFDVAKNSGGYVSTGGRHNGYYSLEGLWDAIAAAYYAGVAVGKQQKKHK